MSAMIEEYDAQMMDYSMDSDIHMHTSGPSPKNDWPHPEATMEDATTSVYPVQEDVEIDMDQYYESVDQEYEMADEQVVGTTHDEPVDVDVYDASRETASHTFEPELSAPLSQPHTDVFAGNSMPAESALETPAPSGPVPSSSEDLVIPPPDDASTSPLFSETRHLSENPTSSEALTYSDPQPESLEYTHSGFATAASEQPENLPALEYATEALHSSDPPAETEDISAHEGTPRLENSEGSLTASSAPQDLPPEPAPEHHSSTDHEAPSSALPSEEKHGEVSFQAPEDPADAHHQNEEPTTDYQQQQPEEHVVREHNEAAGVDPDAGDPHEISEGVYIDPPPPVLLDLPSSSEHSKYCLFNAPGSRSGSHSPVEPTSTAANSASSFTVLLSSRPTLYYERLMDVFQALREEERVRSIPELFDGELVFDAYDLQLVISEDNSHACEVNLHDLNELHDGLGIAGPLRLRLTSFVPRFITKYHSLKDQIARLTIGEGDHEAEEHPQEQNEHEVYEGEDDEGAYEDAEDGEPTQTEEDYYDSQPHEEYAEQPHPDYEQHPDQNQEQAQEHHDSEDAGAHPSDDHQQAQFQPQDQEQILREQAFAPTEAQSLDPVSDNLTASELINDQEHHLGYPAESDLASAHDQQSQHGQGESQVEAVDVAQHSAENPDYHEVGVDGEEARALEDENEYEDSGIALRDDDVSDETGVDVLRGEVEEVENGFGANDDDAERGPQNDNQGQDESVDIEEFDEDIHRDADTDASAGVGQDNTEYEEYTEPREEEEEVGEEYAGEAFAGEVQDDETPEAGSEGNYLELEGGEELQEEAVFEGEGYIDEEGVEVSIDDAQHEVTNDVVQDGEVDDLGELNADDLDGAGTDITDSEAARLLDYVQAQVHSHSPQGSQVGPGSVIGSKKTDYAAYSSTEDSNANAAEQPQQNQDEENYAFADETFDTTLAENGDDLHEYDNESFDDGGPSVDELASDDGHELQVAAHANENGNAHLDVEQEEPEFEEEDDDDLYAGDLTIQELDVDPDVHSTDSLLSIVTKTSSKRGFEEVDGDDYELEAGEFANTADKALGDLSPGSKRARVQ